jgi:hypothetical protein
VLFYLSFLKACPGAPNNTCYGHGTCSDGWWGTGACTCNDASKLWSYLCPVLSWCLLSGLSIQNMHRLVTYAPQITTTSNTIPKITFHCALLLVCSPTCTYCLDRWVVMHFFSICTLRHFFSSLVQRAMVTAVAILSETASVPRDTLVCANKLVFVNAKHCIFISLGLRFRCKLWTLRYELVIPSFQCNVSFVMLSCCCFWIHSYGVYPTCK